MCVFFYYLKRLGLTMIDVNFVIKYLILLIIEKTMLWGIRLRFFNRIPVKLFQL